MKVILCSCIVHEDQEEEGEAAETEKLLAVEAAVAPKKATTSKELFQTVSQALDIFKGLLCILMVYSHVDLCLVSPAEVFYGKLGHFVGNAASSMCFLGFVFSYGYTCYWAYLSDLRPRPFTEKLSRVLRSAILPIVGAWICSAAWSFMCFKIPITTETVVGILTFYYVWGNGPDFLLSFTIMLLISFSCRSLIIRFLQSDGTTKGRFQCAVFVGLMITFPLLLTKMVMPDCTGNRRYFQFFLPCDKREPSGMANLPALPHFFYFNLGVLSAVATKHVGDLGIQWSGGSVAAQLQRNAFLATTGVIAIVLNVFAACLAYPLYDAWFQNFGNIAVVTRFGEIIRGWSRGPSPLWLLGNLWGVYTVLLISIAFAVLMKKNTVFAPVVRALTDMLQHFGANVLIYLIVSDCLLAGLYRGTFPLTAQTGAIATAAIMGSTRFIHYLGASGRK